MITSRRDARAASSVEVRTVEALFDWLGAACAYAIILGMLVTALAPIVTPLLQH